MNKKTIKQLEERLFIYKNIFFIAFFGFLALGIIMIIISINFTSVSNSKIIPQEVCTNSTETSFECVEWECPEGELVLIDIETNFPYGTNYVNYNETWCVINNSEDNPVKVVSIDDYLVGKEKCKSYVIDKTRFVYPIVTCNVAEPSCKDSIYKQVNKTTTNCSKVNQVCNEIECSMRWRK
jgi:hypothetical protein